MSAKRRILAVASGGGHWVQLLRIAPAFEGQSVTFVTVDPAYREDLPGQEVMLVGDSTRWDRMGMIRLAFEMLWILIRVRPHVVVSTGAAPGCMAILIGRMLGCRTVWLDSIANVEEMSMSGRLVRRFSQLWLTQWPHLANDDGPEFAGRVF